MTPAQAIVKLAQMGLPMERLEEALSVLEAMETTLKAKDNERRAKDRERKRDSRAVSKEFHGQSEEVRVVSTDTPSPLVPPLSPEPLTPPIIPPTPVISSRKVDESKDFEDCWAAYPRKVGKGKAKRTFIKALSLTSAETIKAAIKQFAAQCVGKEAEFIPHMATWLNQERWQDADLQEAKHPFVSPNLTKVYVQYGTDAGDAWTDHFKTQGKVPPRDGKGGWWFPSEYPPQEKAA